MTQNKIEANKQAGNVKHQIRICSTDIIGEKPLQHGLTKIKGVSKMLANAICVKSGIDPTKKIGLLSEEEIKKLDDIAKNPLKYNIVLWLLNRRKDPADGTDKHLITSDLNFTQSNDIKLLQKIKCYRGVRHHLRLPVRGQRTKSNFRKNKGKVAGVSKKKGPQRK